MNLEIPFDKEIFLRQSNLQFDAAWKEGLKKNQRNLIWGAVFLLLGGITASRETPLSYLVVGFGIFYFIHFFNNLSHYSKNKKRFFKIVEEEVSKQEAYNKSSFWEFREAYFGYSGRKFEAKIPWPTFEGYKLIEDHLFLYLNFLTGSAFILGKEEVAPDEWEKILKLVGSKIDNEPEP